MSDEEKISPAAISTAARNTKREAAFSQESENRTQTTTGAKPTRRQPQQVHNPGKIIVGKANLKRDIPIFLGVFGFLAMLAYMLSDVGKVDDSKGKKMSIRDLQELLMKNLEETRARELARKRTIECDLFLATSSIPGAGLGIFAGKHFQEGDEVVSKGKRSPVDLLCTTLIDIAFIVFDVHRYTRDFSFQFSMENIVVSILMYLKTGFCSSTTPFSPIYRVRRLGVIHLILIAQILTV